MPIDPSIYKNVEGPKPLDIGGLISTARGAMQYQGEAAIGDIYKQATNPDGSIDAGKLGLLAPGAGVKAPEIATHAQKLQQGQQTIDRNKLDNLREWWKVLDQTTYSHLNDPDLSHKKVLDSVHDLIGHKASVLNGGIFTPQLATQATSWLWGPDGKPLSPDKIRQGLGRFHSQVQDHLSSSEYVPVGVGPDGSQLYMMRNGAIARDAAMPRGAGGAGAPGGPSMPGAPVQAGGAPAVPFTPPAGFSEVAGKSGELLGNDLASAANYRREVFPLEQAIPALSKLGKTGTGPGTEQFNQLKSFLQSAGAGKVLGIDVDKIKNFDEAKKYLTDWVMANGSTGTNDKLAAAFASNANVGISNAAAIDVAKSALAVRRMRHAQAMEFTKTGLPEGQYSRWAAKWNASQDPRAYGFDLMNREAAGKFLKSMSKEDRARFETSLATAESNQLTSPRGGWNAE